MRYIITIVSGNKHAVIDTITNRAYYPPVSANSQVWAQQKAFQLNNPR